MNLIVIIIWIFRWAISFNRGFNLGIYEWNQNWCMSLKRFFFSKTSDEEIKRNEKNLKVLEGDTCLLICILN